MMHTQQMASYQDWRLRQMEHQRQSRNLPATSAPVVYVMHSQSVPSAQHASTPQKSAVFFFSAPAVVGQCFESELEKFWQWSKPGQQNTIVATYSMHKWRQGTLHYYGAYLATCLDTLLFPGDWVADEARASRRLHETLDTIPLLLLVDATLYWQGRWLAQDPNMRNWSLQWEPSAPTIELWRYLEKRMLSV